MVYTERPGGLKRDISLEVFVCQSFSILADFQVKPNPVSPGYPIIVLILTNMVIIILSGIDTILLRLDFFNLLVFPDIILFLLLLTMSFPFAGLVGDLSGCVCETMILNYGISSLAVILILDKKSYYAIISCVWIISVFVNHRCLCRRF